MVNHSISLWHQSNGRLFGGRRDANEMEQGKEKGEYKQSTLIHMCGNVVMKPIIFYANLKKP